MSPSIMKPVRQIAVLALSIALVHVAIPLTAAQSLSWSWSDHQMPTARWKHATAFDAARGELVLFGGQTGESNTWVWNGTSWRLASTVGPSNRWEHAMAYDQSRQRVVMAGGTRLIPNTATSENLAETWEWDGSVWTPGPALPQARSGLAMAYDAGRSRIVMYGGLAQTDESATKTYEYDGVMWSEVPGAVGSNSAGERFSHAMAHDSARGRVVLVGSGSGSGSIDVFEWDGAARTWTARTFASAPGRRLSPQLAYDASRSRIVLFGGEYSRDTWLYNGTTWTRSADGPLRDQHSMSYDPVRGGMLVFGGLSDNRTSPNRTLWLFNGTAWQLLADRFSPAPRLALAMSYDELRQRAIVFGGRLVRANGLVEAWSNAVFEWNGETWTFRSAPSSPSARSYLPLVFDRVRNVHIAYGGGTSGNSTASAEVWEWSGSTGTWSRRTDSPAGRRWGHAAVYDAQRRRMVMFGGINQNGVFLSDTWTYDGSAWVEYTGGISPTQREGASMVYDSDRNVTILFGGSIGGTVFNDTWEWDGQQWRQIALPAASRPPARRYSQMAYDAGRRAVVLVGGIGSAADQWLFDGTAWRRISGSPAPVATMGGGMVYDTARNEFVLFGGTRVAFDEYFCSSQTYTARLRVCLADIAGIGGPPATPDGLLTGDDFNAFIAAFAASDLLADLTGIGGPPSGPDGLITGDDFNAFVASFAQGCP